MARHGRPWWSSRIRAHPSERFRLPAHQLDRTVSCSSHCVEPTEANGLPARSQLMVDKTSPARRDKCGPMIGRIEEAVMTELDERLAFILGLADRVR
jgi:mRNA-degrading endonuclease toxin of MazEF toxin-antitoxin module